MHDDCRREGDAESSLAMIVSDNAGCLTPGGVLWIFASKNSASPLAPTGITQCLLSSFDIASSCFS